MRDLWRKILNQYISGKLMLEKSDVNKNSVFLSMKVFLKAAEKKFGT